MQRIWCGRRARVGPAGLGWWPRKTGFSLQSNLLGGCDGRRAGKCLSVLAQKGWNGRSGQWRRRTQGCMLRRAACLGDANGTKEVGEAAKRVWSSRLWSDRRRRGRMGTTRGEFDGGSLLARRAHFGSRRACTVEAIDVVGRSGGAHDARRGWWPCARRAWGVLWHDERRIRHAARAHHRHGRVIVAKVRLGRPKGGLGAEARGLEQRHVGGASGGRRGHECV